MFWVTLIVAGAGSSASAETYGPPIEPVPLPGPLAPASDAPYVGVGIGIGPIWPADATLDVGFYTAGSFAFWFNRHVALELDVGHTMFNDDIHGGKLTVNPIVGYVVLSLPLASGYGRTDFLHFRLAAGAGALSVNHSFAGVENPAVLALQTGVEWAMTGGAKLFVLVDTMWADTVVGDRPIFNPLVGGPAIPSWDLELLTALRIGVEFTF
jgi:hypothetical protein